MKPDFENLDQNYRKLQHLYFRSRLSSAEKIEILQKIYSIEAELNKIRKEFDLFEIDPLFSSESVYNSFERHHEVERRKINKFENDLREEIKPQFDFFRAIDFQYYLIFHLLLNNERLSSPDYGLSKVIESFIEKYGAINFKYEDLIRTESGATRCRTNLRFAFDNLRKAGLINQYDINKKKVYRLSYFGFFVAIHLANKSANSTKDIFSLEMKKSNASNFVFSLDPKLNEAINELSKGEVLLNLMKGLQKYDLNLPSDTSFEFAFKEFQEKIDKAVRFDDNSQNESNLNFKNIIGELNVKYSLEMFMNEISLRFNIENYFRNELNFGNSK